MRVSRKESAIRNLFSHSSENENQKSFGKEDILINLKLKNLNQEI